ncbi:MAG: hypothetical protein ABI255_11385 [Microbacteriaceae bacterium]
MPQSRLAAGIVAINGEAVDGLEEEYRAHFTLRRRVYVDQTGQLAESDLHLDGTDRDDDDARSVTFAVFENHKKGVRVVGVSRLILRGESQLPIEQFCPDSFDQIPLGPKAVEVSRVISRHESAPLQELVQWHLFALMLAHIANQGLGRTFAIIEPWLERHLRSVIAIERIGAMRYSERYLDYNVPIEIDIPASTAAVNRRDESLIARYRAAEPAMAHFGHLPQSGKTERVA